MKTVAGLVFLTMAAYAQLPPANYDETKVPKYTLPDPLLTSGGKRVDSAKMWREARRPEILRLFETEVYGRTPAPRGKVRFEVMSVAGDALGGKAVRKQVRIWFGEKSKMDLLLYVPRGARGRVPVFLGLNFNGNQAVSTDPGIAISDAWMRGGPGVVNDRATEASRGSEASRWAVEKILSRGYGLATACYGDIEPDRPGDLRRKGSVRVFFLKAGQTEPAANEWGAIGAWAWGLSRAMDYLETDKDVDARRVAVMGHSRLGKTALWAGAQDERFALVISNDSGEGGAALSRRQFGERIRNLNTAFPHWFCPNYRKYNDREDELPVDMHELIALIAPRPVYVASAAEDLWADPRGEFLAALNASPVYRLLGTDGLAATGMPGLNQPVMSTIGYHVRTGRHDVTDYDWAQFLAFADKHLSKP